MSLGRSPDRTELSLGWVTAWIQKYEREEVHVVTESVSDQMLRHSSLGSAEERNLAAL